MCSPRQLMVGDRGSRRKCLWVLEPRSPSCKPRQRRLLLRLTPSNSLYWALLQVHHVPDPRPDCAPPPSLGTARVPPQQETTPNTPQPGTLYLAQLSLPKPRRSSLLSSTFRASSHFPNPRFPAAFPEVGGLTVPAEPQCVGPVLHSRPFWRPGPSLNAVLLPRALSPWQKPTSRLA